MNKVNNHLVAIRDQEYMAINLVNYLNDVDSKNEYYYESSLI